MASRKSTAKLRPEVFARDRGVCSECGVDTEALRAELNAELAAIGDDMRAATRFTMRHRIKASVTNWRQRGEGEPLQITTLWEAHHIIPFVEGGACEVENLRTLCRTCHSKETGELFRRLQRPHWR